MRCNTHLFSYGLEMCVCERKMVRHLCDVTLSLSTAHFTPLSVSLEQHIGHFRYPLQYIDVHTYRQTSASITLHTQHTDQSQQSNRNIMRMRTIMQDRVVRKCFQLLSSNEIQSVESQQIHKCARVCVCVLYERARASSLAFSGSHLPDEKKVRQAYAHTHRTKVNPRFQQHALGTTVFFFFILLASNASFFPLPTLCHTAIRSSNRHQIISNEHSVILYYFSCASISVYFLKRCFAVCFTSHSEASNFQTTILFFAQVSEFQFE